MQPSKSTVFKKCCKNSCKFLGADLREYAKENKSEFVIGICSLVWLISSSVLFGLAEAFNTNDLWTAFGIVSFGIPAIGISGMLLLTCVLYTNSCFQRTRVEVHEELNPSLYESWRSDYSIDPTVMGSDYGGGSIHLTMSEYMNHPLHRGSDDVTIEIPL